MRIMDDVNASAKRRIMVYLSDRFVNETNN